jgi:predicted nuclease of predicted toxin-antitoxin system
MKLKLLFDENISYKLCQRLADIFPNSKHIKAFQLEKREDILIWEFARREDFIVVTQHSDFNDISTIRGFPPYIIWLRTGNAKIMEIEKVLRQNYRNIVDIIAAGKQGVIEINSSY